MKHVPRDVCIIPLGKNGQHEAIVSAQDYAALTRWCWNFKLSSWKHGKNVYARRGGGRTGQYTSTVLMHVYILETLMGVPRPSDLHTVDHKNRNTLDDTRGNLRWATKSQQNINRRPRASKKQRIEEQRIAA